MHYLNYNGNIIREDKELIRADNRGLRYGDGIFETMRMVNGFIPLADLHFDRLINGIEMLEFNRPAYLNQEYLVKQISALATKNNHHKQVRIRLMVFRGEGGLYDPRNHFPNYIIQTWKLDDDAPRLNTNGLITDIFPDARIAYDKFSRLKSNNYLPYLMAALYVKRNQLNDCFLLNTNENICDATIANVFIIKDGNIITPSLSEGCVAGVMRRYLIEKLLEEHHEVTQRPLSASDLLTADELFLSNAIHGIKWVARFREAHYRHAQTSQIYDRIIQKIF